jgi:trans-aconitate methyltransferase
MPGQRPPQYSMITFKDPSAIKRYVQRRRLADALSVLDQRDERFAGRVLDYGGGNGELTKMIANRFPKVQAVCYEPSLEMLTEAQENLYGLEIIILVSSLKDMEHASFDYVFFLEVFEHLPRGPTIKAIKRKNRLLKTGGVLSLGCPTSYT